MPSDDNDTPDLSVAGADEPTTNDNKGESAAAEPTEPRANGARGPRPTTGEDRPERSACPGQRNIAGQAGLDEQAKRLERRVASFFDGTAPGGDDEEVTAIERKTKLVCLDVDAGGLQLEIGLLDGLPTFVKKLRVVGTEWEALVLAANAKLRPTRVSVLPGTGPWRWEAVGFEDEQDLSLDQLRSFTDVVELGSFSAAAPGVRTCSPGGTVSLQKLVSVPTPGDPPGVGLNMMQP